MIPERLLERFETLRQKLYDYIGYVLNVGDGHCKSYEGMFTIEYHFPSYFNQDDDATWNIHLSCYLIGPARGYDWEGGLFSEALLQAERDIYQWINEGHHFYENEFGGGEKEE